MPEIKRPPSPRGHDGVVRLVLLFACVLASCGGAEAQATSPRPPVAVHQPEEVAPAFVFFASNADSSYITGEILTLLSGETTAA